MTNIDKLVRSTLQTVGAVTPPPLLDDYFKAQGIDHPAIMCNNENPLGSSPKAKAAIQAELENINRYPETGSTVLRTALAEYYGLNADNVIISNGGDNIITTLMNTYIEAGDEIVVCEPYFFVYGVESGMLGANLVKVKPVNGFECNLEGMLEAITDKTKLVMITNPNNPTAVTIGADAIDDFLNKVPENVIVVLDEAYAEFVEGDFPDSISYVKSRPNVLVIRTFSKLYGLAGLRVGYALASEAIIANMRKIIETFPVNRLAQAAAAAALTDTEFRAASVQLAKDNREFYNRELPKFGFEIVPGQANFMFVNLKRDSRELAAALKAKGIMIKDGYGWGYPEYARISFGTPEENARLIAALTEIIG